jgi:hypothetical protein
MLITGLVILTTVIYQMLWSITENIASLTTIMQLAINSESICNCIINTFMELYTYYTTTTS